MVTAHHPADCADALRVLVGELRAQLDGTAATDDGHDWAADIRALGLVVARATWARDAAIVLARTDGIPWADLQDGTGERDSTLHGRYRRFLAREVTR